VTKPPHADTQAGRDWTRTQLADSLVDSSDDAIVAKTLDGLITAWNRGAEQIYGYSAQEIIGQPMTMLCPPDRAGEVRDFLEKIRNNERVSHFETVRRRRDGTTFAASVTVSPIHDGTGRLVGASSIARDVTEQQHLRAAREQLRRADDLKTANQKLENFTYSVAHDLRAPLRALSGYSLVLLEDYGDVLDEDGRGYAERIAAASEQMATLIDSLLHLSRIARAELSLQPVDLGTMAADIADELQRQDPDRRVRFAIQRPVQVRADRELIRTVLQNLLSNAWKFTSHSDDASIDFGTCAAENGSQCFYVRDNGAGFDAAYADKLFIPFQRLHSANDFAGTGLGLASVQQIVERHGGQVRAEGAVGQGACFYFSLNEAGDE
jgi:PAS domain S-box-containing protein